MKSCLLRDQVDFGRTVAEFTREFNQPVTVATPELYPCLAYFQVDRLRCTVNVCYVYVDEARKLCELVPVIESRPLEIEQQDTFNRSVAAHLLAIVKALVHADVTCPERYEKLYLSQLAKTEQFQQQRKDDVTVKPYMGTDPEVENSILPRLFGME